MITRSQQRKKADLYDNEISQKILKSNGFNIKRLRLRKGWTQTKLAEKLSLYLSGGQTKMNFTFQQIQKYEKADNKTNSIILYAFSIIFNCPLEDFYKKDDFDFPKDHFVDETQKAIGA